MAKFVTLIIAIIALALIFILSGCSSAQDVALTSSGQTIKLVSTDSGQYVPAVIKVKLGDTVRIEGDTATLVAGMDTVVIDGYKIEKKISTDDYVIEFKADKAGDFKMNCANGMGNGRLIVIP
jgi:plastocyanin domain-containing protein